MSEDHRRLDRSIGFYRRVESSEFPTWVLHGERRPTLRDMLRKLRTQRQLETVRTGLQRDAFRRQCQPRVALPSYCCRVAILREFPRRWNRRQRDMFLRFLEADLGFAHKIRGITSCRLVIAVEIVDDPPTVPQPELRLVVFFQSGQRINKTFALPVEPRQVQQCDNRTDFAGGLAERLPIVGRFGLSFFDRLVLHPPFDLRDELVQLLAHFGGFPIRRPDFRRQAALPRVSGFCWGCAARLLAASDQQACRMLDLSALVPESP